MLVRSSTFAIVFSTVAARRDARGLRSAGLNAEDLFLDLLSANSYVRCAAQSPSLTTRRPDPSPQVRHRQARRFCFRTMRKPVRALRGHSGYHLFALPAAAQLWPRLAYPG